MIKSRFLQITASLSLVLTVGMTPVAVYAQDGADDTASSTTTTTAPTTETETEHGTTTTTTDTSGSSAKSTARAEAKKQAAAARAETKAAVAAKKAEIKDDRAAKREKVCEAHKQGLTNKFSHIVTNSQRMQTHISDVLAKAQKYNDSLTTQPAGIADLISAATAAKATSDDSIAALKAVTPSLDCNNTSVASDVATFKTAAEKVRTDLKAYRTSVKAVLKSLETTKKTSTTSPSTPTTTPSTTPSTEGTN